MDPQRRFFWKASRVSSALRPPWHLAESQFIEQCTRCGDCIEACPQQVIVKGDGGFPTLNFSQQGCTFCGDCVSACAAGALESTQPAIRHQLQVASSCLLNHAVACASCQDFCDEQAIRIRPVVGGRYQLQLDHQACTSCGSCIGACPVQALSLTELVKADVVG